MPVLKRGLRHFVSLFCALRNITKCFKTPSYREDFLGESSVKNNIATPLARS